MEHSTKIGSQEKWMWNRKYATSKLNLTHRLRNHGNSQRLTQTRPGVYVSMDQRNASGWRGCLFTMESLEPEGLHKHLFIWNIRSCWVSSLWKSKRKGWQKGRHEVSGTELCFLPAPSPLDIYIHTKHLLNIFFYLQSPLCPVKKKKVTDLTVRVIGYLRGVKNTNIIVFMWSKIDMAVIKLADKTWKMK